MSKLPEIHAADNAARANDWKVSSMGPVTLYERPYSTIEVRYGLGTGTIRRVTVARYRAGVSALDPADLIAILNSHEGLQR